MDTTCCPDCGSTDRTYIMKILVFKQIQSGISKEVHTPRIKEICTGCGRYIKFAPQIEELINIFNSILEKNVYVAPSEERML